MTVGLEDNGEDGSVGDSTAVRDGDGAGAAARLQAAVNAIAKDVGAVAAARGLNALGKQAEELFKGIAGEVAVRICQR